jgi:hypothetical protein
MGIEMRLFDVLYYTEQKDKTRPVEVFEDALDATLKRGDP